MINRSSNEVIVCLHLSRGAFVLSRCDATRSFLMYDFLQFLI